MFQAYLWHVSNGTRVLARCYMAINDLLKALEGVKNAETLEPRASAGEFLAFQIYLRMRRTADGEFFQLLSGD